MDPLTALTIITTIAQYVPMVIGAASVAASALPKPPANSPWAMPRSLLDYLAFNFGNAKNLPPPPPPLSASRRASF